MTLQALAAKIDTKLVDKLETLQAIIPSLEVDADFLGKYGGKLMDEKASLQDIEKMLRYMVSKKAFDIVWVEDGKEEHNIIDFDIAHLKTLLQEGQDIVNGALGAMVLFGVISTAEELGWDDSSKPTYDVVRLAIMLVQEWLPGADSALKDNLTRRGGVRTSTPAAWVFARGPKPFSRTASGFAAAVGGQPKFTVALTQLPVAAKDAPGKEKLMSGPPAKSAKSSPKVFMNSSDRVSIKGAVPIDLSSDSGRGGGEIRKSHSSQSEKQRTKVPNSTVTAVRRAGAARLEKAFGVVLGACQASARASVMEMGSRSLQTALSERCEQSTHTQHELVGIRNLQDTLGNKLRESIREFTAISKRVTTLLDTVTGSRAADAGRLETLRRDHQKLVDDASTKRDGETNAALKYKAAFQEAESCKRQKLS